MPYWLGTIAVMIVAGVLGSYCRKVFERADPETGGDKPDRDALAVFFNTVIPGIVASFVVPLFLSVGKSEVFTNTVTGVHYTENIFILFAFCLLAAVSARSFVNALAQQALQKAVEANQKADEATELVSEEPKPPPGGEPKVAAANSAVPATFQGTEPERIVLASLLGGRF